MESIKQELIDQTKRKIEKVMKEIEESDREIKMGEAQLKVEQKMAAMTDLPAQIAEDIKYSIIAIETELSIAQNKSGELKRDLETLKYRSQVILKFEDEEL